MAKETPQTLPDEPVKPAAPSPPYTVGDWGGHVLYTCAYCPWTTFTEPEAWEHVANPDYRVKHQAHPQFPQRG